MDPCLNIAVDSTSSIVTHDCDNHDSDNDSNDYSNIESDIDDCNNCTDIEFNNDCNNFSDNESANCCSVCMICFQTYLQLITSLLLPSEMDQGDQDTQYLKNIFFILSTVASLAHK